MSDNSMTGKRKGIAMGLAWVIGCGAVAWSPSQAQLWFPSKPYIPTPAIVDVAEHGDWFGVSLATGDFNGDGISDVAVGVPFEDLGGLYNTGAVNVIYGAAGAGLTAEANQFLYFNNVGLPDVAAANDWFGNALAAGDYDCDTYDDLAIGVPGRDLGSAQNAGSVVVVFGSPEGLHNRRTQHWHQNLLPNSDDAQSGDRFGSVLAAGNFDGDFEEFADGTVADCDDLAIGVPYEDPHGRATDAGAVNVLYGSHWYGLSNSYVDFLHAYAQEVAFNEIPEATIDGGSISVVHGDREYFGFALTVGDFNNDGYDDLAIGVPGKTIKRCVSSGWWSSECDAGDSAGYVRVVYGTRDSYGRRGLTGFLIATNPYWFQQSFYQGLAGIPGRVESGDRFGSALAAGDFDGDGADDLAIGVPGEDIESTTDCGRFACVGTAHYEDAGALTVVYGRSSWWTGLEHSRNQAWHRGKLGDTLRSGEYFGSVLAAGNVVASTQTSDLVIGSPWGGPTKSAGSATVIPGSLTSASLQPSRRLHFDQRSDQIEGAPEGADYFGRALGIGDFNGDGLADLTIGVPGDNVYSYRGTFYSAGAVHVLYGEYYGPVPVGSDYWHQDQ